MIFEISLGYVCLIDVVISKLESFDNIFLNNEKCISLIDFEIFSERFGMLESMDSGNGIFEYCFVLNNSFILRKENILLVLDNL